MAVMKDRRYLTTKYHQRPGRRMIQVWAPDHEILLSHVIERRTAGDDTASMASIIHELVVQAKLEKAKCRRRTA